MSKVAIIESKPSRNNYRALFNNAFEFDLYHLASNAELVKVLKRDVDIDIDIDAYEWIILVGSETLKYYTKMTSITSYNGVLIQEKFLPVINPAMIHFKPEAKKPWETARDKVTQYITGELVSNVMDTSKFIGIEDTEEALEYIQAAINAKDDFIALDSETSALYPRNGYMMGLSLTYEKDTGAYISTECVDERVEEALQYLFNSKTVVFHNAKFDLAFFEYHFNFKFPRFEDTMLLHYVLDETPGTHGLKDLALKYTDYGNYDQDLTDWRNEYCRAHRILKSEFTYDLIPFDIIKVYAAIDTCVTDALYRRFKPLVTKSPKFTSVYENLLIKGTRFLTDIQDNGVPFNKERLLFGQETMQAQIAEAVAGMSKFKEIAQLEKDQGKPFNPNSTLQLRKLLFDYIGLKPTGKKTAKGAHSTDAEVLDQLGEQHEIPAFISNIRKSNKIKNTYLDKIIPQLDRDGRLRTNFNLQTTTSGRLSSSGKLNMQQLPRDNPAVKGCIMAKEGHKIISMDLTTAEVYCAAVLSDDLVLQDIFRSGGNFHSSIAKKVFNLECPVEEVEHIHKTDRQAAKAVTFGIMYGAGANKIAEQVTKDGGSMSARQAQAVIDDYFNSFWKLKEWLEKTKEKIENQAYIYSPFGRKRRLPNVRSDNRGVRGHEVRSGVNFIVQSVSSDINLMGAIDMNDYIKAHSMKSKIFALVHDSVLAEVPDAEVDEYCELLKGYIQTDRGIMIPGCPVGCDFEIGDDYSFGKFDKVYGDDFNVWNNNLQAV